jgi:DNA-binding NarL/FixJ family response regulator
VDRVKELATASPESHICIYTATAEPRTVADVLLTGADCYLLKRHRPTAELLHNLHSIAAIGDPIIDQLIVLNARAHLQGKVRIATAPSDQEPPTARELDVLREIAAGYSDREIEQRLHIALGTIRTHVQHLMTNLGARNRPHLVRLACEQGLLDAPPDEKK